MKSITTIKEIKMMKNALFALIVCVAAPSCRFIPQEDNARSALKSQGFTDVSVRGMEYIFTECAEGEIAHPFTAVNPAGLRVSGTACCGEVALFKQKGCTIRF